MSHTAKVTSTQGNKEALMEILVTALPTLLTFCREKLSPRLKAIIPKTILEKKSEEARKSLEIRLKTPGEIIMPKAT